MSNLSPKIINSIILKNGLNIKKNLGQNFLIDDEVISKIIDFSHVSKDDIILEIGPGLGSLTDILVKNAKKVIAVELDKGLCKILRERYRDFDNFTLVEGDFLDIAKEKAKEKLGLADNEKVKCVANLPYYITSPIIMALLQLPFIDEVNIMVQKEVGERIFATPSTKDYGILTLFIQYYSKPTDSFIVPRSCFYPVPNVDSMVLKLIKNNNCYYSHDKTAENLLFHTIKSSFALRRKKLINSLSNNTDIEKAAISAALSQMGLSDNVRAENLTLDQYITLSSLIGQK